jgi:hypothetical protein
VCWTEVTRPDFNLLGLFLAACGDRQRDSDDEQNMFHREITSFNPPDFLMGPHD